LHQVGDLFELNVKLRCQKVKVDFRYMWNQMDLYMIVKIFFLLTE